MKTSYPVETEAFILVGGRSSRLGRDKTLEIVGGRTLAERAVGTVRDSRIAERIFFVAGNQIGFAIEARRLDTPFIFDTIEDRGPLGGLYTALTHATARWVFILASDLPFVTPELIVRLSHFIKPSFGAVIPEQPDGRLQPLCAFYDAEIAKPLVDEIIHRPRVPPPMHELAALLGPRIVTPSEYDPTAASPGRYFINVNTEGDLEAARKNDLEP